MLRSTAQMMRLALLLLVGCATPAMPSTRPATRETGPALASACAGRDGWSDPAPPARIYGNSYYVGTCGISVILIDTPSGLVLIDAATAEATPSILANIRELGFDPRNVRYLLATHEHFDHVGGLASLQAATGARVLARREAVATLSSGAPAADDPQRGAIAPFAGVTVAGELQDGESLPIPGLALTLQATPGHTPGSTSWTWRSCAGGDCRTMAYVDSLIAISADDYRFSDHPDYVATFRRTFLEVAKLPCDVLITPHPGASSFFERLAGEAPLEDANGCRAYAERAAQHLDERMASEGAARP